MNAIVPAALLARRAAEAPAAEQGTPPAPGVQRTVWHAPYGTIVIEVVDGEIFVNGDKVEPAVVPKR